MYRDNYGYRLIRRWSSWCVDLTWLRPHGGDGVQDVLHLSVLQLKRQLKGRLAQDIEMICVRSSLHQLLRHADRPAGRRQHQRAPARALLVEVDLRAPVQQQPDHCLVSVLSGRQQSPDLRERAGVSAALHQLIEAVHEGTVLQQEFGHVSVPSARSHAQDAGTHPVPAVDLCAVLQQNMSHAQMTESAAQTRDLTAHENSH